ncbi:hypothetical protein [Anaeromyxobacter dehalogenans]|uniref:Uncharacterized protein n=1 Tax=Anaeromyxobacter dehalogenans (strain 2CP-C) TaxID=290397 RepID=Q2IIP5_ANADE|nr:hypothetical protein [Anaeromyxobacter dehalogenans]ABC81525.1 hypothetical protein Adeh_1752 [Anaeromyxobacter dehalogenans 2CP-C]
MRGSIAVAVIVMLACGGGDPSPPAPGPQPQPQPQPDPQPPPPQPQPDPQPAPQPQPPPPAPQPEPQPPPPEPPPPPPQPTACFLEEGGHGEWLYHFARIEGDCGAGNDFSSNMAPGTSFTPWGPIDTSPYTSCETLSNVVSSDRCQKNISRECLTGGGDVTFHLVEEFHQESATRITFAMDFRRDPMGERVIGCSGTYYGTITKQ